MRELIYYLSIFASLFVKRDEGENRLLVETIDSMLLISAFGNFFYAKGGSLVLYKLSTKLNIVYCYLIALGEG